jgi:hypothetical protein
MPDRAAITLVSNQCWLANYSQRGSSFGQQVVPRPWHDRPDTQNFFDDPCSPFSPTGDGFPDRGLVGRQDSTAMLTREIGTLPLCEGQISRSAAPNRAAGI